MSCAPRLRPPGECCYLDCSVSEPSGPNLFACAITSLLVAAGCARADLVSQRTAIASLRTLVADTQSENDALTARLEALEQAQGALEERFDAHREALSALVTEREQLVRAHAEAQERIGQLEDQLAAATRVRDSSGDLRTQLDDVRAELEAARARELTLRRRVETFRACCASGGE